MIDYYIHTVITFIGADTGRSPGHEILATHMLPGEKARSVDDAVIIVIQVFQEIATGPR